MIYAIVAVILALVAKIYSDFNKNRSLVRNLEAEKRREEIRQLTRDIDTGVENMKEKRKDYDQKLSDYNSKYKPSMDSGDK